MKMKFMFIVTATVAAMVASPASARDRHHSRGHGGVSISIGSGYGGYGYYQPVRRGYNYDYADRYYDNYDRQPRRHYRERNRHRDDRHHRRDRLGIEAKATRRISARTGTATKKMPKRHRRHLLPSPLTKMPPLGCWTTPGFSRTPRRGPRKPPGTRFRRPSSGTSVGRHRRLCRRRSRPPRVPLRVFPDKTRRGRTDRR